MTGRTLPWVLAALLLAVGCSSDAGSDAEPTDAGRDAARPDSGAPPDTGTDVGGDSDASSDGSGDAVVRRRFIAVRIDPAVLEVPTSFGVPATGQLHAIGVRPNGTTSDITTEVLWTTESAPRVRVAPDGTVTAPGTLSGHVLVHADLEGHQGEAEVVVRVAGTSVADDVSTDDLAAFTEGTLAPAPVPPRWLYPENDTVYPAGLRPPLLQWAHDTDPLFHLVVEVGDHARLDFYTRERSRTFTPAEWALVSSDFGTPITMTLESTTGRGAPLDRASPNLLRTADASLEGSVYYWQIRTGDIMEIPYDSDAARPLFSDNANTGSCRGCHAITRDGGRIGFMYNGGDNPRAGLAWVDTPEPPIVPNGTSFQWDSMSFEPAGLRAAAAFSGSLWLADTTPDRDGGVANLGPVPGVNDEGRKVTHPAWSPDGTLLAWIARDPGGVDWSFTWGDLWVSPWDSATETFGSPRLLVARGPASQDTVSYPTWSPDGRWLAYSQGPDNRGEPPANLFIADPLTGDSTQLVRGAPGGQDVMPAFSPFREGGYYWLLFYSRRPYGAVTTNKQLWVMAIDERHVTGTDPSHPAFWLPGQNAAETNITGYWARVGCVREGNECKSEGDCCVGLQCIDADGVGTGTCQRVECVFPGRPCVDGDVCCPGYECSSSLVGTTVCVEAFR